VAAGGKGVRQIAATQAMAIHALAAGLVDARQVGTARGAAALDDALGDFGNDGVQRTHDKTPWMSAGCGGHSHSFLAVAIRVKRAAAAVTGTNRRTAARASGSARCAPDNAAQPPDTAWHQPARRVWWRQSPAGTAPGYRARPAGSA